jgi:hypothetical protein
VVSVDPDGDVVLKQCNQERSCRSTNIVIERNCWRSTAV